MKHRKMVLGLALAVVVLLATNAYSVYLVVDRSISLAYSDAGAYTDESSLAQAKSLLEREWLGLGEREISEKLKAAADDQRNAGVVVKQDENGIWFDQIHFEFGGGRLVKIQ